MPGPKVGMKTAAIPSEPLSWSKWKWSLYYKKLAHLIHDASLSNSFRVCRHNSYFSVSASRNCATRWTWSGLSTRVSSSISLVALSSGGGWSGALRHGAGECAILHSGVILRERCCGTVVVVTALYSGLTDLATPHIGSQVS